MAEKAFRMAAWHLLALLVVVIGLVVGPAAAADEETFYKKVGEYTVYIAVMPSELIRGPRAPEIPGASPQRPPAPRDTHHVMVSIFESRTGVRVSGFHVKARVAALGFSGEKRDLEPISIGGAVAYGNTFPMLGRGPFRVDVEFGARGAPHVQQATFYFTHPGFAVPKTNKGESR